jgi:hypothetical protein
VSELEERTSGAGFFYAFAYANRQLKNGFEDIVVRQIWSF